MVSSRDRICQRRDEPSQSIARAPPPAFLFPNQQCQRPEPLSRGAHRLTPDVGGGGYLSNLEFRVKPFFFKTVRTDPTKPPEGEPSRPWRPSREERQPSQVRISRKLFLDLKNLASNSCEPLTKPSGAAPSIESPNPCQSRILLSISRSSRLNTSQNLGILIELFASVRSGASIEASPQSQPPRFSILSKGRSHNEETKRDPWAAEAARLDPLPSRLERGN